MDGKAEVIWLFWYIERQSIQVALGNSSGLGGVFTVVSLTVIFGTIVVYVWLMNRSGGNRANR